MTGMTMESDREDFLKNADVSRETLGKLDSVIEALDDWRKRTNLIGRNEWPSIWMRHVWDSLQICDRIDDAARVVDLGSGAGFPGLTTACAKPNAHVTMIESVGKKCAFLRHAIEVAGLSATVIQDRVESVDKFPVDIVTARAFAPLPKLLDYASPWLESGARGIFHKGQNWHEELTKAQQVWNFAYEAIPSRVGGSGILLEVTEFKRVSK